MLIVNQTLVSL